MPEARPRFEGHSIGSHPIPRPITDKLTSLSFTDSAVPTGLDDLVAFGPSNELLGYSLASLRD